MFHHGFYWPTARDNAHDLVTKCAACPFYQCQTTKHACPLNTIDLTLAFAILGIAIVRQLPKAKGRYKYLFVGIDTFSNWIEAEPVANITQEAVVMFLRGIVHQFGVPRWVIMDNDTQFKSQKFKVAYAKFGIQHQVSLVAHPQTNG